MQRCIYLFQTRSLSSVCEVNVVRYAIIHAPYVLQEVPVPFSEPLLLRTT